MNVLKLNRKIFRFLGLCLERNATRREFYRSALANVFILASLVVILVNSAMYFFVNLENTGDAIYSLMQIVGYAAITGTYASFMMNNNTIYDFFDELQEFVNESKYMNPMKCMHN